jgi:carbon storage regulator
MIGHDIKVTVMVIAGDKVRIGIDAPQEVEVHREEVFLEIQEANRQAASAGASGITELTSALRDQGPAAPGRSGPTGGVDAGATQTSDRDASGSAAR